MKKLSILLVVLVSVMAISLSACTSKVEFKVSFVVDGEVYATVETNGDETIKMPTNPTKEGFTFDGWYWDNDIWQRPFTADSLLHEKLTSDMSVYAKWLEEDITKRSYIVTFNSMGGSAVEEMKVVYGHLLTEPKKPTKTGYAFVGWYKEADCTTKWDFNVDTVTGDITLYAKWVDESTATGCEILNAEGFDIEENNLFISVPNTQEHFAFSAVITVSPYATWTVSSDIGGSQIIPSATVSLNNGDNIFYINVTSGNGSNKKQYIVNIHRVGDYTVTFEPNNGENVITETVEEGGKIESKTVTKVGYEFVEWQYQGKAWDFSQSVDTDMTLTAKWQAKEYDITFDSRNGILVENKKVAFDSEFQFEPSEKKGYTFNGWETEEGELLTNAQGKGLTKWNIDGSITVYANFTVINYKITYNDVNGASNDNPSEYNVEREKITLVPAIKAGYEFKGWYSEVTKENIVTEIDTSRAENIELWAKWELITYTATFKNGEDEVGKRQFTVEDETIDEPAVPEKNGYTGKWSNYEIGANDITVNAEYTPIEYNITYKNVDDAENPNQKTYNIETDTFRLQEPTRNGYEFGGWYSEAGYQTQVERIESGSTGSKTLWAKWTPIEYRIIYNNVYDAENPNQKTYNIEMDTFELQEPTRNGYEFCGWYSDEIYQTKVEKIEKGSTGNKNLWAKWKKNEETNPGGDPDPDQKTQCTVTFDSRNETALVEQTVEKGSTLTEPVAPTKTGYNFGGWYKDISCTIKWEFTNPVNETMTLYAKWILIEYDITYKNVEGADNPNQSTYNIEADTFKLKEPTKRGYEFGGWYSEANYQTKVERIESGSTGNKTFYAKWTPIEFSITYKNVKESENPNEKETYNIEEEVELQDPTRNGYTFGGWYEDSNFTDDKKIDKIAKGSTGSKTLWAKWTPIEYSITYNNVDDAENPNEKKTYNIEEEVELQDPTRNGYTFGGWYEDANFTDDKKVDKIKKGSTGNKTFYAKWTPIEYSITYNNVDDAENPNEKKAYNIEEEVELQDPKREGYTFGGWYTDRDFSEGSRTVKINKGSTGDKTLWAKWTPIEYSITYKNVEDDEKPNQDTYNIETEIELEEPTRNGYTFGGWYTDSEFSDGNRKDKINKGETGDKILWAKWTLTSYNLYLEYEEKIGDFAGEVSKPMTFTIESDFRIPVLVIKETGYTFIGWFTEKADGSGQQIDEIKPGRTGDLRLYAHWGLETYTITYHNDEGAVNTNATNYTIKSDPITIYPLTRTGYTFDGWFSNASLEQEADTMIETGSHGNLDFYAKWSKINYNLEFNLYDGKYKDGKANPSTYTIEDSITFVEPEREGYVFDGWYDSTEGGNRVEGITPGTTGHKNFYARWIHVSTITFNTNGGTPVPEMKAMAGTSITAPETKSTKEHYTFMGWYYDDTCEREFIFDKMPEEDITLYAKWTPINYSIQYVLGGGKNDSKNPSTYTVESDITFYPATKTGYTFVGWFTEQEYTHLKEKIEVGSYGALVLYANYKINEYTISFDSLGGTNVEEITQNYDTVVTEPKKPSKNGYNFVGWYTEKTYIHLYKFGKMPAEDIKLFAKWQLVQYTIHYNMNNGQNNSGNPTSYNIESKTITLLEPTRTGYTFGGWFEDGTFNTKVTQIVEGSYGNKELYAKWNITTYKIIYVVPDGTDHDNIEEYTIETSPTQLKDATKKGYTFKGWFTEQAYTHKVESVGGGEIGEKTLYAQFTANTYTVWLDGTEETSSTVSFDLNGAPGDAPESQTITERNKLKYPNAPTYPGHLFAGWYTTKECDGEVYDFSGLIASDITLFAKWIDAGNSGVITIGEPKDVHLVGKTEYSFKFVPLSSGNITITTIGNTDTLGILKRNGEEIIVNAGMSDDVGSGGNFLIVYNVTAGTVYEIVVRGYNFNTNATVKLSITGTTQPAEGGYVKVGNRTSVTYDSDSFDLPVPEARDGYKFLGWKDSEGNLYTDEQGKATRKWDKDEETVLFSAWERTVYTVTFVTSMGTNVNDTNSVQLEYGERLDLNLYVTTRTNYTFGGWYLDGTNEPYNATTMPDHNITLNARWIAYDLGSIMYDKDKLAVSINDKITPELFGAICIDTDGKRATLSVSYNPSGTLKENTIIIVIIKATGKNNKAKQVTINNVKVYGMPSLTVKNSSKDYINMSDVTDIDNAGETVHTLSAELFGASGTDSFGSATEIYAYVEGDYRAGGTVTVVIQSIDNAGNIKEQRIQNVKVYGTPEISYDTSKIGIRESDANNLTAELFSASAQDSFGSTLSVTAALRSGTIKVGETVTIRLSATDSKGNVNNTDLTMKVYGLPTINEPTKTDFKVTDSINAEALGLTATDTFGESLTIVLTKAEGEQNVGSIVRYNATVIDMAGNILTKEVFVKIYGTPKIVVDRPDIKVTDVITSDTLKAYGLDSFGDKLSVTVEKQSGEMKGGQKITVKITATDKAGNIFAKTETVSVYDVNEINFTYFAFASNLIKLDSMGEEFGAKAIDSFGQPCAITIEAADGFNLQGGETISLYIVATDKAGNIKKSSKISDIKVYDIPTIKQNNEFVFESTDIDFLFTVYDSFNEELSADISVSGEKKTGNMITVTVSATDTAGNTVTQQFKFLVGHDAHKYQWVTKIDPTCTSEGSQDYECSVCGKVIETKVLPKVAHSFDRNSTGSIRYCTVCKTNIVLYTQKENYIYFGEYPQTKVTAQGTTVQLGILAGQYPTSSNSQKWTDYGYYINGSKSSFMWYIDIEFNGDRYRGVYFTSYRPTDTDDSPSTIHSAQDDNGYEINTVYWFKFEPIKWRVLTHTNGTAMLMSDIILDSHEYYITDSGTRSIGGKTIYSNNYKESSIRAWLNKEFFDTAFDNTLKDIIQDTTVDNSLSSTGCSSNSYTCENTVDKVFLLSYKEVTTSSYGFSSSTRGLKSTDYAKSQGVSVYSGSGSNRDNGGWMLRSPYYDFGGTSMIVNYKGTTGTDGLTSVNWTSRGVVPALNISL